MDPLDSLGPLCFTNILSSLQPEALRACAQVCKSWRAFADDNDAWDRHCTSLWADKKYIPAAIKQDKGRKTAYHNSLVDAKRTAMTIDELCDPTWLFKFKSTAGDFYYLLAAGHRMHRHFHRDHTLTGPSADPLWGALEPTYNWVFRKSKDGVRGLFVQVNRFPSLELSRDEHWGWKMENKWVEFTTDQAAGPNPGPPKDVAPDEAAAIAQLLDDAELNSDEESDAGDVVMVEVLAQEFPDPI